MTVCFFAPYHAADGRTPETYLKAVPLYRHLPRELAARGHTVHVVLLFPSAHHLECDGVDYHFVPTTRFAQRIARHVGRALGHDPAYYEPATAALRRVRSLRPDVVHVHGLTLHLNHALRRLTSGHGAPPIVVHFHGGFPPERRWVRRLQRFALGDVARFLFTTHEHARPFVETGLLTADRVRAFMETSSPFRLLPRAACRVATGMTGNPIFLWAGRLHPIKDPLTALRGFEQIAHARPEAQLYMHYLTDELLPDVTGFLAERPDLRGRVHLRGRAPFEAMERIYNSADVLLQASRREFSGCAVLEALSCGVWPVVTDLPSFRAMTDGGRIGGLFPPGDPDALARQALDIPLDTLPDLPERVRAHFDAELAFPVLAARLESIYEELMPR